MSIDNSIIDSSQTPQSSEPEMSEIRLWPAVAILALQLVTLVLTVTPAIDNTIRFGFMMLGPAVCVLLFIGWLLLGSRIRWRDRISLLSGITVAAVLLTLLIHPSMGVAIWIYGVPLAMGLTTAVLWKGRTWNPSRKTVVALLAVTLCWSLLLLARIEGFDGSYWPEFRWRWTASGDQLMAAESLSKPNTRETSTRPLEVTETDWPGFRGPNRNGRVPGATTSTDWTNAPPRELWRIPVGPAWSSFSSVGDHLFTQEQRGDNEVVVCYDANTGTELWRHADPGRFSDVVSGSGPRATPTFAQGRLYTFGGRGLLNCLDSITGKSIWKRDLMVEIAAKLPEWGFSASPMVSQGLVIVYAGGPNDHGLVAYSATTGEPAWHVAATGMNYSSAQLVTLCERPMVLLASTSKLSAVEPATGEILWEHRHTGQRGMAIVQPQKIDPSSVIVPHGDGGGLTRLEVKRSDNNWQVSELWTSRSLKPSFNDFIYHQGHLYGFDQNIFTCIDASSGQRCWKRGRYGFGQAILLVQQELLLITTEHGEVVLLEANPEQHTEVTRMQALTGKTWNHPIVARDRLIVRNGEEAVCYQFSSTTDGS